MPNKFKEGGGVPNKDVYGAVACLTNLNREGGYLTKLNSEGGYLTN